MESKKRNINKILNFFIIVLTTIMVATFIGFCFITPKQKVDAVTKEEIISKNIPFVSAKTKSVVANGYSEIADAKDENGNSIKKFGFTYLEPSNTLYYSHDGNLGGKFINEYNNLTILEDSKNSLFLECEDDTKFKNGSYIPQNITHFKNVNNEFEEIFYNEINDGDFVLIDNYNNIKYESETKNIDSFYLSIGSPKDGVPNNNSDNTYIVDHLTVNGYLYNNTGKHRLDLNDVKGSKYKYWYQYFDLTNIKGLDNQNNSYTIASQEGKYEITFEFLRENDSKSYSFKYTFYLLDSANYTDYPTFSSANKSEINQNKISEYYYQVNAEKTFLNYNPERYNISYTRASDSAYYENIISTFETSTHTYNSKKYPVGIITFTDTNKEPAEVIKQVYILTYFDDARSSITYLYISNDINTEVDNYNYSTLKALIDTDKLNVEYKRTDLYTDDGTDKKITTYTDDLETNFATNCNLTTPVNANGTEIDLKNLENSYKAKLIQNDGKLDLNYNYILQLEDLGKYTFDYNYICPIVPNSVTQDVEYVVKENSSPFNYTLTYDTSSKTPTVSAAMPLEVVTWGYLKPSTDKLLGTVQLNGVLYEVTVGIDNDNQDTIYTITGNGEFKTIHKAAGTTEVNTYKVDSADPLLTPSLDTPYRKFAIEKDSNGIKLLITYNIGSYIENTTTEDQINNIVCYTTTKTSYLYTLLDTSAIFNADNQWTSLNSAIDEIEALPHTDEEPIIYTKTFVSKEYTGPIFGQDIIHIYGSETYFNKADSTTDTGNAKLEEYNKRTGINYTTDFTNEFVDGTLSSTDQVIIAVENKIKEPESDGESKVYPFNLNNLIITNMTPVMWTNYNTLKYNEKTSLSKVYRYEKYTIANDGSIYIPKTSTYTKAPFIRDMYCDLDGLYIVVVNYDYNGTVIENKFQVFAFVIDNSSPTFTIEEEVSEDSYQNLNKQYSNKNIKIVWNTPNIFQYDVYIEINKNYFNTTSDSKQYNFNSEYYSKGNSRKIISGNQGIVDAITECKENIANHTHEVYIEPKNTHSTYIQALNGNYAITLHYGANGNSTITKNFVIDNESISGMKIYEVYQDDADSETNIYKANLSSNLSQITNKNFTFRYDEKNSGANIETTYYKINLNNIVGETSLLPYEDKDGNTKYGITNNYEITYTQSSSISKYYNFAHNTDSTISNGNYFIPNTSCIYLFKLCDDAGNESRYVVIYDNTSPNIIIAPALASESNNIVNDTTRIIWGDSKAISINSNGLDDFSYDNETTENSKSNHQSIFSEAISYINTLPEKFGNIQLSGNNVFIPLKNKYVNNQSTNSNYSVQNYDFYLFPTQPNNSSVKLPVYSNSSNSYVYEDCTGNLSVNGNIVSGTATTSNGTVNVCGSIGNALYTYTIEDISGNTRSSLIWMNLDLTQTYAYGTFDNATSVKKGKILYGNEPATYSLNGLYLSSLASNNTNNIPSYNLTYQYYPINVEMYDTGKYTFSEIKYCQDGKETYFNITLASIDPNNKEASPTPIKTIKYLITDKYGYSYPVNSYPYDIDPTTVVKDSDGAPAHIYKSTTTSGRIYSSLINPTFDTKAGIDVTKEGFYVFKREYVNELPANSSDKRVTYFSYYVDRKGIIDTSSSLVVGDDIGFTLGANATKPSDNLTDDDYKVILDYLKIYNNQKTIDSKISLSSSQYISDNLFTTNKMLVNLRLTDDKYKYSKFHQNLLNKGFQITTDGSVSADLAKNYFLNTILNKDYFSYGVYKIDLKLEKGLDYPIVLIDETNTHGSKFTSNASTHIQGSYNINNVHGNDLYLYVGDVSNSYSAKLYDQAKLLELDNQGYLTNNDYSNNLQIVFKITHNAPQGDSYGKDYGRQNNNYDENPNNENTSKSSLPFEEQTFTKTDGSTETIKVYSILTKYLDELVEIDEYSSSETSTGKIVNLKSTNNETLIFTFKVTDNDYMAQIDPNNIILKKGNSIIFQRENGVCIGNDLVSKERMEKSFIKNMIGNTLYYGIIIFDNNLDDILSEYELANGYNEYRLLEAHDNPDTAEYTATIHYLGNASNYVSTKDGKTTSYFQTTYNIVVDRVAPKYNLAKLMYLDKYVYTPTKAKVTESNYEQQFNSLENHFTGDCDLSNYFFAVDSRNSSSFEFESVSRFDNNGYIYFRKLGDSPFDYTQSLTPDNYEEYYNSGNLGSPVFFPNNAVEIIRSYQTITIGKYYRLSTSLNNNTFSFSKVSDMVKYKIFDVNNYYEILECDEAGNYRVYGIYISPTSNETTSIKLNYDQVEEKNHEVTLSPTSPSSNINGLNFKLTEYKTNDYFLKAKLVFNYGNKSEIQFVSYNPLSQTIYVTDASNKLINKYTNNSNLSPYADFKTTFINVINDIVKNKNLDISNNSHYGYSINLFIYDRIGMLTTINNIQTLSDFSINCKIAGAKITPTFTNLSNSFIINIPKQEHETYIVSLKVEKFNEAFTTETKDINNSLFNKTIAEFKKGCSFTLTSGVWRFTLTDNFNRTHTYYYDFNVDGSHEFVFSGDKVKDGNYTITSKQVNYKYNQQSYKVVIYYTGTTKDTEGNITSYNHQEIFNTDKSYSLENLEKFGITRITESNSSIKSITFSGVSYNNLSEYHIETEFSKDSAFVYNDYLKIYTAIQTPVIRNLNGIILDTTENINLTEDVHILGKWIDIPENESLNYNSKIVLKRIYVENNVTKTETKVVSNEYLINEPGTYEAYITNDLGTISKSIKFTRLAENITLYAVYNVNNYQSTKLYESNYRDIETDNVLIFKYYTTIDYFSYKSGNNPIDYNEITTEGIKNDTEILISDNKQTLKYVDVRVSSNSNIFVKLNSVTKSTYKINNLDNDFTEYIAKYSIYSKTENGDKVYRYIHIHYLPTENTKLVSNVTVVNENELNFVNMFDGNNNKIKSTDKSLKVIFDNFLTPTGDTVYVNRYYNGELVEKITVDRVSANENKVTFSISNVGLHKFTVTDLAGRVHEFVLDKNTLEIYLINQILFTVNDKTPINHQIFNSDVTIDIISELSDIKLYNINSNLGKSFYKDGKDITSQIQNDGSKFIFTEHGFYTVKFTTTTTLSSNNIVSIDKEITSTFNFVIIKENVTLSDYQIPNGRFILESLTKISNGFSMPINNYYNKNCLVNLSYDKNQDTENIQGGENIYGNAIYHLVLKYYDTNTKKYTSFDFKVWISNETPTIISSINPGNKTSDTITITINPGLIYTQIGKCSLKLNGNEIISIDENSDSIPETITIDKKGEYTVTLVSARGQLISSYQFTKSDPFNATTKIVIICVIIGVIVLIAIFFLIRKKGKYR